MIFAKCPRLYGNVILLPDLPPVGTHHDVVLDHWTLYDRSHQMIPDSGFFRGVPNYTSFGGSPATSYDVARVRDCMPDKDFFWLGPFHIHFGHFLVSTLARAWALATHAQPDTLIVYVGGVPPRDLFEIGFVRDCLTALGITADRLVQVTAPIRFPRITVAAPAFTENHSIYPIYFHMLRAMAVKLCDANGASSGDSDRPIYISKEKVSSGVRTIGMGSWECARIACRAWARPTGSTAGSSCSASP